VRRLHRRFEAGGAALARRDRGRPSPRRLAPALRDTVIDLMTTVYARFNDTHPTEKLREIRDPSIAASQSGADYGWQCES